MDLVRAIREVTGVEASDRPADKVFYARDLLPRHHIAVRDGLPTGRGKRPAAIAWPQTTDDVASLVRLCRQEGIKVVPFGAGSGVCGGISPDAQSLIIDLKRMKRWRNFSPAEGFLEVEAGAMGIRLEEDLQSEGRTVGHFPSSILCSTVGGWVAARGAGQCSGLYGKIEDMVAALEVVDGRGEVATLQRRIAGPDLLPLVIGSEGTFGVITAARLRLHPVPAYRGYAAFSFDRMEQGWDTLREAFQMGLRPAVSRLYDPFDSMIAKRGKKGEAQPKHGGGTFDRMEAFAVRNLLRLPGPLNAAIDALGERVFGGATLVLVFEGSTERVTDELETMRVLCRNREAEDLGENPARQWMKNRYAVSYKQAPMIMKGTFVDTMEVAAPWSKLGQLYEDVRRALGQHALVMAHMSHAYPDGCSIYFTFAGSAPVAADAENIYDAAWGDALDAAIAAGGTLSHHHGVGRTKAGWLGHELRGALPTLRALKRSFDPDGILNPGNLIPEGEGVDPSTASPPSSPVVEGEDGTVAVAGDHTLGQIETALERNDLSLGLDRSGLDPTETVRSWIDRGLPGRPDPWLDPVDHVVCGFTATMARGGRIEIPPCPRRAAGPDLWALFAGTDGRVGTVDSLHLRARGKRRSANMTTPLTRNPEPEPVEQRWIERTLVDLSE